MKCYFGHKTRPGQDVEAETVQLDDCRNQAASQLLLLGTAGISVAAPAKAKSPSVSMQDWMDRWMGERRGEGALHVGRFKDRMYYLLKPIAWKPDGDKVGKYPEVVVPQGFVTDFASIPRIFWSLLPPDGDYTYPAIIHDYLYRKQDTTREVADDILRMGMQDFKVESAVVTAIYRAVRAGGGGPWAANTKEKSSGNKRILIKSPEDPTTTWAEWRTRKDVFGPE